MTETNVFARILPLFVLTCLAGCVTNRPDLHNWNQTGGANWAHEGQTITGTGTSLPGFLVSPTTYQNFELTVEFRPDKNVNSGILIHCQDPNNIQFDNCYEANIWDDHPKQEYRTGSVVLFSSPPRVNLDTVDQWNRYRISATENQVSVWLNGTLTAEITAPGFTQGYIALQSAGGVVRFRNLTITPL